MNIHLCICTVTSEGSCSETAKADSDLGKFCLAFVHATPFQKKSVNFESGNIKMASSFSLSANKVGSLFSSSRFEAGGFVTFVSLCEYHAALKAGYLACTSVLLSQPLLRRSCKTGWPTWNRVGRIWSGQSWLQIWLQAQSTSNPLQVCLTWHSCL